MDEAVRSRIVESAYACVARHGIAKSTVEQAASGAGVSRATVYRYFPGGRDQLVQEAVAWETSRFVSRLVEEVGGSDDLAELLARALIAINRMLSEHDVLQRVLATEPERLLPSLTLQTDRVTGTIAAFVGPYLADLPLPSGMPAEGAADYLARMLLSVTLSPGRWDLADPEQAAEVVRVELLGWRASATGATTVDNETYQE